MLNSNPPPRMLSMTDNDQPMNEQATARALHAHLLGHAAATVESDLHALIGAHLEHGAFFFDLRPPGDDEQSLRVAACPRCALASAMIIRP